MPKSKEYVSSSDESCSEDEKTAKRKRKAEKTKEEKSESSKKTKNTSKEDEDEPTWDIGNNKFVKVRTFKGRLYVDIREMYTDKNSGDLKPGKKGICLDMKTWRKFMENVEEVDKVAKSKC